MSVDLLVFFLLALIGCVFTWKHEAEAVREKLERSRRELELERVQKEEQRRRRELEQLEDERIRRAEERAKEQAILRDSGHAIDRIFGGPEAHLPLDRVQIQQFLRSRKN
jgi:G:T-mismatch repair DNA endonuclease (very short patch repair protein)